MAVGVDALLWHLRNNFEKPTARELKGKLSLEEHDVLCSKLNGAAPLHPNDADTTKENINGILKKWTQYCIFKGKPSWREAIQNCDKGTVMSFLRYICENHQIKKTEALRQFWRQFKMLYDRINGRKVDSNDAREVVKYIYELQDLFELDPMPKDKPVLGVDDVLLLLTHLWARDTCIFPTEDQRHGLAAILLLSIFTGARPAELVDAMKRNAPHKYPWEHPEDPNLGEDASKDFDHLDDLDDEQLDPKNHPDNPNYNRAQPWDNPYDADYNDVKESAKTKRCYKSLCYEDIRLWIVRNPKRGERDLLAIDIKLKYHKGVDKKPKPTIYLFREEENPIFCPIAHILAIALRDDAILVRNRPEGARTFFESGKVKYPIRAVQVQWRPHMLKVPIFRQAVRTADGFRTSKHKGLRYSTYAFYLDRLGWETGFEQKLTGYCARRCTGNAVDGVATTAVRDQIMRHEPGSAIFNSAYNNTRVRCDIQSAVLERPSVDGLDRAFAHMSITCDPRAPTDVPKHIRDALPPDPLIAEWKKERSILTRELRKEYGFVKKAGGEKAQRHKELDRKIKNRTNKREEALKVEYRKQYFYHIHHEELERLLNNIETEEYVEPVIHHQLPERTQLHEVICYFPEDLSTEDIIQRRIRAIDLMLALCARREEPRPKQESSCEISINGEPPKEDPLSESSHDPELPQLICEKTQCIFFCNGGKKTFSRPAKMMDHVERHLSREPMETIACRHPVCETKGLVLDNKMHFKNHVRKIHGISLRAPRTT